MAEDKPITDRENFPREPEGEKTHTMFIPASALHPGAAYNEGCRDGYRMATKDFLVYVIVFIIISTIATKLSATN